MIQFDIPAQQSSIIKVIGVGGGGSNAVNYMYNQHVDGVDFIICNTDAKAIEQSNVPNKIQLGPSLTQGLGAGADPSIGKQATEESFEEIRKILEVNTKMAFITVGMGGGTGTGGAPIIAQICKELGILTVGIITTPFSFEGPKRIKNAEEGIKQLTPYVDTLLIINNDKLRLKYGNLKMKETFAKADNILATAARCITDIINSKGHIIVDFADVCTVMKNGGVAILGKAEAEGENRAQIAIEESINSPLLNDNDIKGAKWILININSTEGDYETTMDELETINCYLREQSGEDTDVIMGMGYDDSLDKKISITIVATGFEHSNPFDKTNLTTFNSSKEKENKIVYVLDNKIQTEPTNIFKISPNQTLVDATEETTLNPTNLEEKVVETISPTIELTLDTKEVNLENIADIPEPAPQKTEINLEAIEKNLLDQEVKFNFNIVEYSKDENPINSTISQKNELINNGILQKELFVKPTQIYVSETPTNIEFINNEVEIFTNEIPDTTLNNPDLIHPENIVQSKEVIESNPEIAIESKIETELNFLSTTKLDDEMPVINNQHVDIDLFSTSINEVSEVKENYATFTLKEELNEAKTTPLLKNNFLDFENKKNSLPEENKKHFDKFKQFSFALENEEELEKLDSEPAFVRKNIILEGYNHSSANRMAFSTSSLETNENNELTLSSKNKFTNGNVVD